MSAECAFRKNPTGSNTTEGHAEAGQYHVTGLDLLLKALGLVQCAWKPSMRKLLLPLFSMAFFNSPIVICSMALLVSCTTIYAQLLLRWQASVVLPDALCKQMLFRMLCTRRVEEDAANV